jgi:hypothetical protein
MKKTVFAAAAAASCVAPALAEPFIFSGVIDSGLGYVSNPFIRPGQDAASPFVTISVTPTLTRKTARTVTEIRGIYSREEYFRRYGHTENASAGLSHAAQLTQNFGINGQVSYLTTTNPLIGQAYDPSVSDPLTIGQRTKRLSGGGGFSWQPSALDSITGGVNASNVKYSGGNASSLARDYDQYGANLGYSRTIDARTSIGVQVSANKVDSKFYPNTQSVQPALTLQRKLSEAWTFDGNIGLIAQKVDGRGTSTSLGYGASLCGNYPRTEFCVTASRQSTPSGIGGLRKTTQFGSTLTQRFSERSRVVGRLSYDDSKGQGSTVVSNAKVYQARMDYGYDLTQRLTVGAGARYQRRELSGGATGDSIGGTVNLTMKVGR